MYHNLRTLTLSLIFKALKLYSTCKVYLQENTARSSLEGRYWCKYYVNGNINHSPEILNSKHWTYQKIQNRWRSWLYLEVLLHCLLTANKKRLALACFNLKLQQLNAVTATIQVLLRHKSKTICLLQAHSRSHNRNDTYIIYKNFRSKLWRLDKP